MSDDGEPTQSTLIHHPVFGPLEHFFSMTVKYTWLKTQGRMLEQNPAKTVKLVLTVSNSSSAPGDPLPSSSLLEYQAYAQT